MTIRKIIFSTALATSLAFGSLLTASAQTKPATDPVKPATKTTPCKAPDITIADVTEKGFTVKWTPVEGAKGYQVFAQNGKEKNSYRTTKTSQQFNAFAPGSTIEVYVMTTGCATSGANSASSNKETVKTKEKAASTKPATK